MMDQNKLIASEIPRMNDQELNLIILSFGRSGPYAWAVFAAEDEIERRIQARRSETQ